MLPKIKALVERDPPRLESGIKLMLTKYIHLLKLAMGISVTH